MKLLIDGHNLIRYGTGSVPTAQQVDAFLARMARYSRYTGHEIIIVFDGGEGLYPYEMVRRGMAIHYAGARQTADDVIKKLLPRYHKDELVLISNDRQLNAVAEQQSIISVDPAFFMSRVREKGMSTATHKTAQSEIHKTSTETNEELDTLMHTSPMRGVAKSETTESLHDTLKDGKKTKLERRLEAVIRKL